MTLLSSEPSSMVHSTFQTTLNKFHSLVEQRKTLGRGKNEDSLKHKRHSPPLHPDLVQADTLEGVVPDATNVKRKKTGLADDLGEAVLGAPELGEQKNLSHCPVEGQGLTANKWQIADSEVRSARMEGSGVSQVLAQLPGHYQCQETELPPRQLSGQVTSSSGQSPQGSPREAALCLELGEVTPQGVTMCEVSVRQGQLTDLPVPTLQTPAVTTVLHNGPDIYRSQRPKKAKDGKAKVRKLKYHQYVPPDQKACEGPVAMDAAYLRLLRQQQLYLQLQILSQQQTPASPLAIQTAGLVPDGILGFARALPPQLPFVPLPTVPKSPTAVPVPCSARPELLPANLDDLTVSELRQQLRKRGLPVSGTKPALLERLKPYQLSGPKMAPLPLTCRPQSPPSTVRPALLEKQKVIERLTWKLRQEQPPILASHPPTFPGPVMLEGQTENLPSPRSNCLLSPITDTNLVSTLPEPQEGSPLQPQNGSLCNPSEMQKASPDISLSPASLHSFFPMEEVDFESEFQGSFDREAVLSSALGADSRELAFLGAPRSTDTGKFQTLEEELTQAIRSAELSQSPSIEEILNEPLGTKGPCARLEPDSPLSPRPTPISTEDKESSLLLSAPPLDLLPELSHCQPFQPLSPPSSPEPCPPAASPPHSALTLDPADWVDTSPDIICPTLASVFCADLLEPPELGINRMVDLLVDQW